MSHSLTRTHIYTSKKLIEEVDKLVGSRRRSEFIASAVDEKVRREKLIQAVQEAAKLPADRDIPGWETPEAVSKWVRDIRAEADRDLPQDL